jgi:peptide/nickel transport system permease protein
MTEALISTRRNGKVMSQAFKLFRDAPLPSQFGFVMVSAYIFVAVLAPVLAPYAETEIVGDAYEAWSEAFPLGTDAIGRDMLTRMIYGARNTIGIAFIAASIGFLGGGIAGMMAAMLGGWTDQVLSRLNDILMAIPGLIFILLVLSFLGTSIPVLVSVIGLFEATRVFRVTRAAATNVEVMEFVEVAKLRGENLWWLIRREVLPNITAPLVAEFGIRFTFTFLFIAGLSFLGLGIQPPTADWGSMVRENSILITFGDFTPLLPAAAIALLTISVNFIIDWFLHKSSGLKE